MWHLLCVCVTSLVVKHHGIHQSRKNTSPLNVFGSHEYRLILHIHLYRFQILFWIFYGRGNAINHHTWILFQLILESSPQYWKCDALPMRMTRPNNPLLTTGSMTLSQNAFLHVHHGVEHVCHPEIVVQILSSRRISFLKSMDFILGRFDKGLLLLLPLPPLLLSRRPEFSRFVETTVSRCTLEGLTFVSTYPYSWYATVGFGRFETRIIEVLFLLAQFFWTVIHHPRIIVINLEIFWSIQWWYVYWVIISNSFKRIKFAMN